MAKTKLGRARGPFVRGRAKRVREVQLRKCASCRGLAGRDFGEAFKLREKSEKVTSAYPARCRLGGITAERAAIPRGSLKLHPCLPVKTAFVVVTVTTDPTLLPLWLKCQSRCKSVPPSFSAAKPRSVQNSTTHLLFYSVF